jgi:hypothetical protein
MLSDKERTHLSGVSCNLGKAARRTRPVSNEYYTQSKIRSRPPPPLPSTRLTAWSKVFLWELMVVRLVMKFSALYRIRMVTTVSTTACHWIVFRAIPARSQIIFITLILMFYCSIFLYCVVLPFGRTVYVQFPLVFTLLNFIANTPYMFLCKWPSSCVQFGLTRRLLLPRGFH